MCYPNVCHPNISRSNVSQKSVSHMSVSPKSVSHMSVSPKSVSYMSVSQMSVVQLFFDQSTCNLFVVLIWTQYQNKRNEVNCAFIMTLSKMTFSIMALSITSLFVTFSINHTQHNTLYRVPLCWVSLFIYCYAECRLCWVSKIRPLYLVPIYWMSLRWESRCL